MATVYLIPAPLDEAVLVPLPAYVREAILSCEVLFAENERTTRRYFKKTDSGIIIDNYQWFSMKELTHVLREQFVLLLKQNKTIGIVSEAGCPGIADPGQELVALAHQYKATVKPLVGPSSILLALMASGLNGQHFCFHGYLPIEDTDRVQKIKQLENQSAQSGVTQIFIETPYRNQKLLTAILRSCRPQTRLCVAVDITSEKEQILSMSVNEWKNYTIELHKRPVIFLIHA